ncbi:MAG: PqqD family protein [Candidatus Aenigmarchaeota archaeon]|nr:PqqD family protein [Candidatus Aenigmarchaeota archaeon]
MNKKNPVKTRELEWQRIGNVYILIDKKVNKTYSLDPIAFMVWIQCDGKTNIEEIVDIFSVNGNRDIVKTAINGILEKLEGSGLIKWM